MGNLNIIFINMVKADSKINKVKKRQEKGIYVFTPLPFLCVMIGPKKRSMGDRVVSTF